MPLGADRKGVSRVLLGKLPRDPDESGKLYVSSALHSLPVSSYSPLPSQTPKQKTTQECQQLPADRELWKKRKLDFQVGLGTQPCLYDFPAVKVNEYQRQILGHPRVSLFQRRL